MAIALANGVTVQFHVQLIAIHIQPHRAVPDQRLGDEKTQVRIGSRVRHRRPVSKRENEERTQGEELVTLPGRKM